MSIMIEERLESETKETIKKQNSNSSHYPFNHSNILNSK